MQAGWAHWLEVGFVTVALMDDLRGFDGQMDIATMELLSVLRLTGTAYLHRIKETRTIPGSNRKLLPPRSTAGQLTLDQHIGVRIPGGQPNLFNHFRTFLVPMTSLRLRGGCRWLQGCFECRSIETVDTSDNSARGPL